MKQLIFIDDSGDPGFKEASSDKFIIASAVFMSEEVVRKVDEAIAKYRKSLGWSSDTEFKFSKTNKKIIIELLRLVADYDFDIYAVYIDKTKHDNIFALIDKSKLYGWTVKELLMTIPLKNAHVKLDGRSDKKTRVRFLSYLRREINKEEQKIKRIRLEDSTKNNLIQLADIIAGAINRSIQKDKTDSKVYLSILQKRIATIKRITL